MTWPFYNYEDYCSVYKKIMIDTSWPGWVSRRSCYYFFSFVPRAGLQPLISGIWKCLLDGLPTSANPHSAQDELGCPEWIPTGGSLLVLVMKKKARQVNHLSVQMTLQVEKVSKLGTKDYALGLWNNCIRKWKMCVWETSIPPRRQKVIR